MTARTEALETSRQDGIQIAYKQNADKKIFQGSPVFIDTTWYAFSNDGVTDVLVAWDIFVWICLEDQDTTDKLAWEEYVRVFDHGVFTLPFSDTLWIDDMWKDVYVNNTSDNSVFTITDDAGVQAIVWTIVEILSTGEARVKLTPQAIVA